MFHGRWRREISLLAAGEPVAPAVISHAANCAACGEELQALRATLLLLERDPLRTVQPPIAFSAFATRVHARLSESPRPRISWWALAAATSAVLALLSPLRPAPASAPTTSEPASVTASVPDDVMLRMERRMTRQQAARYLNEAQAVLMGVAANAPPCPDRKEAHVDLAEESRRSRELLARRSLLLELDDRELASARPVLEDVEHVLRAVASLEACARAGDLQQIHDTMARRRLLMKIDLMTRELQG